jgi:hypothetical protein
LGKGVQGKSLPEREVPSLLSLSFPKRGREHALVEIDVVKQAKHGDRRLYKIAG